MKFRVLTILAAIALIVLIPISGVFADTTVLLSGTAAVTNQEPITFTLVGGDGSYDPATHAWAVSTVGGGVLHLTLKATNTSLTNGYTVNALVAPVGDPVAGITATWNTASKYIAVGASYDFILTATVIAGAPLTTANFSFSFNR
jgi:hypothetical protein